jgi:serine/threonine protein kinase
MHPRPPSYPLAAVDDQPTIRCAAESECGGYRLHEVIGTSSRAVVHLATRTDRRDDGGGARFAIKRAAADAQGRIAPEHTQTLLREIQLMRRIEHPAIVRAIDDSERTPTAGGEPFLVLELIDGIPLDRLTRRLRRVGDVLPSALAAFVMHEIATGLGHVHGRRDELGPGVGFVHGQLRPKEIMLSRGGEVKLLAFGPSSHEAPPVGAAARSTRRHACYRAPEQVMGRAADERSDIFTMGAIFWELLVGPPLFSGSTEHEAVTAVLNNEVPPPSSLRADIPARLDAIVMRALARDPRRRYANAEALALDLARGLPSRPKLTRYTASLVANQLGPNRNQEATMPTSVAPRTPRPLEATPLIHMKEPHARRAAPPPALPLPGRVPTPTHSLVGMLPIEPNPQPTPVTSPGRRMLPPPIPLDARKNARTTLPLPPSDVQGRHGTLPLPPAARTPEIEITMSTPTPLVAVAGALPERPISLPAPSSPHERRATVPLRPDRRSTQPLVTAHAIKRTPTIIPAFLTTTPTPMLRSAAPPARPAHRRPLLSRAERIERMCLQWLSAAAVGFVGGVFWQERHMTEDVAMAAASGDRKPVIVAIDTPPAPPAPAPAAPASLPAVMPTPMIVQVHTARPHRSGARTIASNTLRAASRRSHAIR